MQEKLILDFLILLGSVRSSFRDLHISLENLDRFKSVETSFGIYNKSEKRDPTISIGLDTLFSKPMNDDRYSAGFSFIIFKKLDSWILEGEVGFSSYDIGFDEIDSFHREYENMENLLQKLEFDVATLIEDFKDFINKQVIPFLDKA